MKSKINFEPIQLDENALAKIVVDICYEIHTTLGPGLLESVYEEILCYELKQRNLEFTRQKAIPVISFFASWRAPRLWI